MSRLISLDREEDDPWRIEFTEKVRTETRNLEKSAREQQDGG